MTRQLRGRQKGAEWWGRSALVRIGIVIWDVPEANLVIGGS